MSGRRSFRIVGVAMALAALPGVFPIAAVQAHPHVWIDIQADILFDDDGRVAALGQRWLFDEFYTAFVTEGLDGDGDGAPDAEPLDALLRDTMTNLRDYDFFSRVERGAETLDFGDISDMAVSVRDGRLEMAFTLPLATPVAPGPDGLRYAVFDPSFYVEMLHAQTDDAIRLVDAPDGCLHRLRAPNPDADALSLASSLDQLDSAGTDLGILFAEWVTVRCE
ncbi:MAG: DUF1007 family protein [Inquilinaceae bacterium]